MIIFIVSVKFDQINRFAFFVLVFFKDCTGQLEAPEGSTPQSHSPSQVERRPHSEAATAPSRRIRRIHTVSRGYTLGRFEKFLLRPA